MSGVPKSTVCAWVNDLNRMRAPALMKIIEELDPEPEELYHMMTGRRRR